MKKTVAAMVAALTLACTTSVAAKDLKFITLEVAPWASFDPVTNQPIGVFPEVVKELERRTGNKISMALHPFVRIDHELEAGAQDCTIIVWSEERARIVVKGELVSTHIVGVVARKGVTLKTYADLKPLTISVLRGLELDPKFDGDTALKKYFDTDYLTGIRKIAHNRLDAVAGAIPTIAFLAKQEGMAGYLGDRLVLGEIPLLLQCAKKSPNLDVMPDLNKAIRDMREDGTLERIKKANYFS
ncbi:MAG TPA: transporter substrate-binding domain-containing protein [Patescibacteria group bacterium]|nr:transporter substrate-binding domain-containing protein [Patescibacteria group bacterium]